MIKANFYLDKSKVDKSGRAPVYMQITYNSQRIRKSLRHLKVRVSDWNESKQRVRKPGKVEDYNGYEEFNSRIEEVLTSIHKINRNALKFGSQLTNDFIISRIENPDLIEYEQRSFFVVFDEYISTSASFKKPRTIKGLTTVKNFLLDFEKSKKLKIQFESIDFQFFELLRTYCFSKKGISTNYFAKIVNVLKAFLQWSLDHEYHNQATFKKFFAPEIEKEVIFLELDELTSLLSHPFDSPRLSHVRDIYCFSCATGLRFSDTISLTSSQIKDGFILKKIIKTGEVNQKIPLNWISQGILEKYKDSIWNPLPKISAQKFNDYIKECCQLAGINSELSVYQESGGQRTEITGPKWQFITSHTARKTFVINSLRLGMHETVVKGITGHKKQESFRRYVKIADDFKQIEMDKTWGKIKSE